MAKRKKLELDDFGIDNDLDIPDFDFEPQKIKDDRNPATKLGKAALGGAKDTVLTPQFLRKLLKESLPRGYGSTLDLADQSADSLKNAYHSAAKEIKPALNDIKRTTNRAMPTISKVLPKGIADQIKKWSTSDDQKAQASRDQQREDTLQMMLGDVFKFQATQGVKDRQEDEIKDRLKEGIAQSRHRDQLGQLDAIRLGISSMAAYQQKVESGFQRKSLELQFRQYYIAVDMLEETKRQNAATTSALESIMKNTGLPDFVKLKNTERFKDIMRNNFLGSIGEGIFDKRRNFIKNLSQRAADIAKDKAMGFAQSVRGATDAANMGMDASEMMDGLGDFGPSKKEIGAGLAGGLAADAGGGYLAKWLGKRFARNKGVVRKGNQLQQMTENVPQIAGRWARSNQGETGVGVLDWLLNFGKDTVNSVSGGPSTALHTDGINNLQEVSIYTRQANKSITEIIPGFLARIFRELQVMRTGNDKIELTTYDYKANRFSSASATARNAMSSIIGGWGQKGTKSQIDALLDEVDKDGSLTPRERVELGQRLLKDNMNNQYADKAYFTDPSNFGSVGGKAAGLFSKHLDKDEFGSKEHGLNRRFNALGSSLGDSRETIQNMANAGMLDFLRESGVVNEETGAIDMDRLYDLNYGTDYQPGIEGAGPGTGKLPNQGRPARAARPQKQRFSGQRQPNNNQPQFSEELLKAVRESNTTQTVQAVAETLMRIEARLAMGLPTYQQEGPPSQAEASGWNMSIKTAIGRLGGVAGKGLKFAKSQVDGVTSKLFGGAASLYSGGKQLASSAFDKLRHLRDVYVPGEAIPRLTAWKLKAGMYKDKATGKVIKTYKDISGAVVDENGNIVLDLNEVKTAFVNYGPVRKVISALGAVLNTAKDIGNNLFNGLPGMVKMAKTAVVGAWNGLLNRAEDVYVKGMENPLLRANIMRAGGYFSKLTGKVIRHPGQIDGPVLDAEGNVVLTGEDAKAGLLNKFGQPIRTGALKALGIGIGLAKAGIGAAINGAKWLKGQLASGFRGVGDWFNRFSLPDGILFSGGKTMIARLTEIRDILLERMPAKKKVFGDVNGDGVREGSYDDIMAKRKQQREAGKPGAAGADAKGGGMGGGIGALISKLMGKKKDEEEDHDGSLLDDAADVADIADAAGNRRGRRGRVGKAAKGKGLWGRMKGMGKFGLKGAGKMLGLAGAAYGGYSAYDNIKKGNYGEAAVDGALTAGGVAMTAGAGWGLLGTIGAGIAAVIGSPVLLGALAVAAVGAAGYYGYKALTKKRVGVVSKYRYAQYGFPEKDTDHVNAVFGLEDKLESAVIWVDGKPDLDPKKVDKTYIQSLVEDFGVNRKDERQVRSWSSWFANRFKPVYMTHLAALKAADPTARLSGVDDLKGEALKRYFELSRFAEGPYDLQASPFAGMDFLQMDSSRVRAVGDAVQAEISKLAATKDKNGSGMSTVAPAAAAATTAAAAVNASNTQPGKGDVGVGKAADLLKKTDTPGSTGLGATFTASFQGWKGSSTGELDALSVIRFKTYGLSEMVSEKVRALQQLESQVDKNVSYTGKGVARWTGDLSKAISACGGAFGVEGQANAKAYAWQGWFTQRFLPTYLNYLSALKSGGGKSVAVGSPVLTPAAAVDVAIATYTTQDIDQVSVWTRGTSPWPGYELNTDPKSIEPNLQALREQATRTTMKEETGTKESKGTGTDNGSGITQGNKPGVFARAWEGTKEMANKAMNAVSSSASAAWQGTKNVATSAYKAADSGLTSAKSAITTGANAALAAGGTAMTAIKNGVGGLLASVPMPTADGSYAALKATIDKASEMVGVDPKLMATMAAIESGFRATVKAGTSSATGLYQFISGTWKTMVKKYGAKYGIDASTPPTDPRANALMGAEFIKENAQALSSVKSNLTDTDLYLAHFLGAGGAKTFLKSDPNAIAANSMSAAANANRSIFYNRDGTPRTFAETYAEINRRVRSKGKQFGLDAGNAQPMGAGGGRGSINPASATPDTTGSTGIASDAPAGAGGGRGAINPALPSSPVIPVSNTAPGVSGADTGAASAPAYSAAADSQAASTAIPVGGGGFSPTAGSTASQSLVAQSQAQRDEMTKVLGSIDSTGQKALSIASDQLSTLRLIAEILGKTAGSASAASQAAAPATDSRGRAGSRQADMTAPPLSMAKS